MKLWRYGQALERLGDRYRLDGVLGSGGMADVCLAWDERERCEVAIKVIKANELDQRSLDRFIKEASQVARWRHSNILRIYGNARLELLDAAQGSIVPYIVMEYACNGDLQHRLTPGVPYPFAETLKVFEQLCLAVAFAHEQGVIHRDLKPHNVLFRLLPDYSEQVALSDFGLAVEMNATHFTFASGGTLPYMAPEQLRGQAQAASDIFALGVILYQLCTGHLPFQRTLQDLRRRGPLPRPPLPSQRHPMLPPDLDAVILTALSEKPEQRYPDALTFWECVQDVIDAETIAAISQYESRATRGRVGAETSSAPTRPRVVRDSSRRVRSSWAASMRQAQNTGIVRSARQTRKIQAIAPEQPQSNTSGMPVMDRLYTTSAHTPAIPSQRAEPVRAALVSARTGSARSQSRVPRVQTPRRGKRTRGRGWVGITIALVCFILLSLIVGLNSSTLFPAIARILHPNTTNSVTIKTISEDYTFSTLNGQPSNLAQNQIAIYTVTTQSQSQPQTIQGTGHTHTQGTAAHGTLTFLNGKFVTQSVAPGTILTGKDGVKVITEAVVNIPPTDNAGNLGVATVAAHSIITGAKGNIAALDINQTCCDTVNSTIFVKNTAAFTGGQDAKDYAFIQQSDIDAVTNAQRNTLEQQAQKSLAAQVSGGQELLAGSVQCTTQASADQPVGDKGQNVTATKVTVTSTCRGTSYDKGTVKRLVTAGLQAQMAHRFGSGYVLQENSLQMQVTTANGANGLVLHVHATAVSVRAETSAARTKTAISPYPVSSVRAALVSARIEVLANTHPTSPNWYPKCVHYYWGRSRVCGTGGACLRPYPPLFSIRII